MQVNRKCHGIIIEKNGILYTQKSNHNFHSDYALRGRRQNRSIFRNRVFAIGAFMLFVGILLIVAGCGGSSSSSDEGISGQLTVVTSGSYGAGTTLSSKNLPHNLRLKKGPVIAGTFRVAAEPDFVADEILVKYRSGAGSMSAADTAAGSGYRVLEQSGRIENGLLLRMKLTDTEKTGLSMSAQKERTLQEIERLKALPSVEYAQPNYIYKPLSIPNDPYYTDGSMWNYPLILVDHVWKEDLVNDLSSVVVAVIDTGIVRSNGTKSGSVHPDLTGIFVDEYDFISDTSISRDGDGRDADATDPGDNGAYSSFHGTHVAGTIGALTNNGIGIAGVAGGYGIGKGVRIMPLRVLGAGGGTTFDIAAAVRYAAGDQSVASHLYKADVINMSLGSTADDPTLSSAISYAASQGVVMAAAAGNDGTSSQYYPAAYPEVISVSAVGIGAEITGYSNYGDTIEIAAPGGSFTYDLNFDNYPDGVWSTLAEYSGFGSVYNVDVYALSQGTSMATPHVAAAAALVKAANAGLSASAIRKTLRNTAIDLGTTGKDDYYGYGLLNTYAAVTDALSQVQSPILFPFPKTLKFEGTSPASKSAILKNIANSNSIVVTGITKDQGASWVSFSQSGTADATGMKVTVSVNTSGIADGSTHTERLKITWNDGFNDWTDYVYILYNSIGFAGGAADVGDVYVVAIDYYSTSDVIQYYTVTNINQSFVYSLTGLPTGTYIIGASTDRNNDGYIFEFDDTYGFYPEILNVEPISYTKGDYISGIDFELIY